MKSYFTFLLLFFISNSCGLIIIDSTGRTNDYEKLTEEQISTIIPYSKATRFEVGKVYTLNATELLSELNKHPESLVYVFKNACTGELCKPMAVYEEYAQIHQLKLFLVMNGFGNIAETTDQPLKSPLYAIDSDYYEENIRAKYERYFANELRGLPREKKSGGYQGNLYFFSGNQLDTICRELPKQRIITPSF
jgi:hypothetical protein